MDTPHYSSRRNDGGADDDDDDRYYLRHHRQSISGSSTSHSNHPHHNHTTYMYRYSSYSEENHTITTSVSIRVTPIQDHLVSWGVLWAGFMVALLVAAWQVVKENRILAARRAAAGHVIGDHHRHGRTGGAATAVGDGESVSTADVTRSMFRRLLLLAMIMRVILMPIQIWSDPMWWQFVADTLPEMVFASAWTLLVTFFVQLVGIATGTGTNTSPGLVISATAYAVYFILIIVQIFNKIAPILLYALMCCIYATLFGVVMYFCPKLLSLIKPSQAQWYSIGCGLTTRLAISTAVCFVIFVTHAVYYARLVVAPPRKVSWWWQYGLLELAPALYFLIVLHPNPSKGDRTLNSPTPEISRTQSSGGMLRRVDSDSLRRVDSGSLAFGSGARRDTAQLVKGVVQPSGYGAITASTS